LIHGNQAERRQKMKSESFECTVGIYNTQATVRVYADKTIVTAPYVKWVNNTGTLAFRKVRFDGPQDAETAYGAAMQDLSIARYREVIESV
jgi:hypothetical protein